MHPRINVRDHYFAGEWSIRKRDMAYRTDGLVSNLVRVETELQIHRKQSKYDEEA
jgi:hypothetical protein